MLMLKVDMQSAIKPKINKNPRCR